MRRAIRLLAVVAVMMAVLVASAVPAFTQARHERGTCIVVGPKTTQGFQECKRTTTPSGNTNQHAHFHPK
jgi:hypothetical protein